MSEQIRAAFHRHLQSRGIPSELFQRDDNGAYEFATVEHDWSVWQAALAANSASSATPCAEQCWACAESGIGCNLANDCAQAPAPQAVVGESSDEEAERRLFEAAGFVTTKADGMWDATTWKAWRGWKARAALTPSPAPSAAPHQGADALREFVEKFVKHGRTINYDPVNDRWVREARAALAQHQAPQQGEQQ